ncbi:hypothetical protein HPB47_014756 [Ixodes persulcatus]|uniref:Uncharacterized protein n=1 Tax=Ixodes persulcatus TaxID=34615 RepID=A0AC60QVA4_IXOPE|nr:hypothetical protein HPB47_014756 [Ixodes persulcatus]
MDEANIVDSGGSLRTHEAYGYLVRHAKPDLTRMSRTDSNPAACTLRDASSHQEQHATLPDMFPHSPRIVCVPGELMKMTLLHCQACRRIVRHLQEGRSKAEGSLDNLLFGVVGSLGKELSTLGGTTLSNIVRLVMERTVRKEIQLQFSLMGRKGKRSFKGTRLYDVVLGKEAGSCGPPPRADPFPAPIVIQLAAPTLAADTRMVELLTMLEVAAPFKLLAPILPPVPSTLPAPVLPPAPSTHLAPILTPAPSTLPAPVSPSAPFLAEAPPRPLVPVDGGQISLILPEMCL